MKILSCSIDLTKIDKSKIKPHANGSKYYSISVILNDEKDQFGNDVGITEGQTKEEREAKVKKVFIGNGRTVFEVVRTPKEEPAPMSYSSETNTQSEPESINKPGDNLPF